MKKNAHTLMIVLWLVMACDSQESPTQTSLPPTAPPTATMTATLPSPSSTMTMTRTATPTLTQTPTTTPPTATATPRSTATVTPTPSPLDNVGAGMIAFVSDRDGDDEIYLMSLPGAPGDELTLYQLTHNTHDDAVPDWSPDGAQMAFASNRDGNWEIYVMDVAPDPQGTGTDGLNVRRLTNYEGEDTLPAWSPDGSQIAFASKRDGDWEIYVMNEDGTDLRRLTHNPDIDTKPSWSPDGSQIVFDSGVGYGRHIFVMDADGSNQRLVARAEGGWPDWSPAGTQIAYFGRLDGNPEIYVVNVADALQSTDGTDQRRLTRNNSDDWEPSWSPDGEWLLFVSGHQTTDIFAMRADGSETRRLTHDRYANWSPVWRPSLTTFAPSGADIACACASLDPLQTQLVYDVEPVRDAGAWAISTPGEEGMDADGLPHP